jgi:hypothetical protein
MSKPATVERDLLVFSIWAVLGFGGLAFLLEGFSRDSYITSFAGIAAIVVGFVAHIVVNAIFDCSFRPGEAALGIGTFGVLALAFIGGWATGGLSMSDYLSGLTLFAVLAFGLPVYLSTRYGLRGAFSRFHHKPADSGKPAP